MNIKHMISAASKLVVIAIIVSTVVLPIMADPLKLPPESTGLGAGEFNTRCEHFTLAYRSGSDMYLGILTGFVSGVNVLVPSGTKAGLQEPLFFEDVLEALKQECVANPNKTVGETVVDIVTIRGPGEIRAADLKIIGISDNLKCRNYIAVDGYGNPYDPWLWGFLYVYYGFFDKMELPRALLNFVKRALP